MALTMLQNGDLANGSIDYTIKIWNATDGTLKMTLNGLTFYVRALTVLQNGDLASGSWQEINLVDLIKLKLKFFHEKVLILFFLKPDL